MIDWVHHICCDWAEQYRRREFPVMGYPATSQFEEFNYVHNPAGLTQEAQELSDAVFRMRAVPDLGQAHSVLIAHYVFAGSAKAKARMLCMDKNVYWRSIQDAHCYLAARITQSVAA